MPNKNNINNPKKVTVYAATIIPKKPFRNFLAKYIN